MRDASLHAWVELWCPEQGWMALDPTNDIPANLDHVTLAWGRDYNDVAPLRVLRGGGTASLVVEVTVEPGRKRLCARPRWAAPILGLPSLAAPSCARPAGLLKSSRHDQRFSLNWSYLEAIAGGVSAIDLSSLALRQLSDAKQFAREYGYDGPARRACLLRPHPPQAVGFVRETFLSADQRGEIPSEVADAADPLQLLLMASCRIALRGPTPALGLRGAQVMHGLFYIDSNLKLRPSRPSASGCSTASTPCCAAKASSIGDRWRGLPATGACGAQAQQEPPQHPPLPRKARSTWRPGTSTTTWACA